MLKIRRPLGRLIFNMGIAIPGKTVFLIETAPGSGIVRFTDLKQRNAWLSGAKHLKNHSDKISISQDLLPVLRALKTELLGQRKDLPPQKIQIEPTLPEILAVYWIKNRDWQCHTTVGHQRVYSCCCDWFQPSDGSARTKHIVSMDVLVI